MIHQLPPTLYVICSWNEAHVTCCYLCCQLCLLILFVQADLEGQVTIKSEDTGGGKERSMECNRPSLFDERGKAIQERYVHTHTHTHTHTVVCLCFDSSTLVLFH